MDGLLSFHFPLRRLCRFGLFGRSRSGGHGECGGFFSGLRHAIHDPAYPDVDYIRLELAVERHGADGHFACLGIFDFLPLDDFEQDAVRIASYNQRFVIAGGQDFVVGGHQIIVIVLTSTVTGNAVAFDNRRDVNIIRGHFPFGQCREERLDLWRFETVIPHVPHKGDHIVDLAEGQFAAVSLAKRVHAFVGASIGDDFLHSRVSEGIEHIPAVDGRDHCPFKTFHTRDRGNGTIVAVTFHAVDRVQVLARDNLVGQGSGDFFGNGSRLGGELKRCQA